jgi:NDP-hexose 4,6-dehydratase
MTSGRSPWSRRALSRCGRQPSGALIPQIITHLASGSRRLVLGALDSTRDFTYVTDTARAFLTVGSAPASAVVGEVFNCGSGCDIAIGRLAERIAALMGVQADVVEDPHWMHPKASEAMRLVCDASKLSERTRWQSLMTRDQSLRSTIDWFSDPANLTRYKTNEYHRRGKPAGQDRWL